MRIEGSVTGLELDVKRLYLPGLVVKDECPKCQEPWKHDFDSDYLSYPVIGSVQDLGAYCQKCEHEWSVKVVLRLSLELATS